MSNRELIQAELDRTIDSVREPSVLHRFSGKVREIFDLSDERLAIVVTDRVSVFDYKIGSIPFKGQVLNQLANWWYDKVDNIGVPHHLIAAPHPNVSIVRRTTPLPIEIVIRAYLTGTTTTSSWHAYQHHDREISGIKMPQGMRKNQPFSKPICTPTTKAIAGHDKNISKTEILRQGLVEPGTLEAAESYAFRLFEHGQVIAQQRGLILVDTKYEMGCAPDGELIVIDEVHTPDSSRFWLHETYDERFAGGLEPESLDKEFVRRMIIENGYSVTSDEHPKIYLTDAVRAEAAERYVELFKRITGQRLTLQRTTLEEITHVLESEARCSHQFS